MWLVYKVNSNWTLLIILSAVDTNEMRMAINSTVFGVERPGNLSDFFLYLGFSVFNRLGLKD